jgi:hypothetical protein
MKRLQAILRGVALVALGLMVAAGGALAQNPCSAPDNGTGTVTLPPAGCQYLSPSQVHMIINGLPAGTTIILKPIHRNFICRQTGSCNIPGGPLGGEVENFSSTAVFQVSGTGALSGWNRVISVPLGVQVATAPRTNGAPVQTFKTDMQRIQGSISGDPDFDLFQVVGGTANGFPSPGSTTLTRQADGSFAVSSQFNVGYSIRFTGAAGGKLAGYEGVTTGTVTMSTGNSTQTGTAGSTK